MSLSFCSWVNRESPFLLEEDCCPCWLVEEGIVVLGFWACPFFLFLLINVASSEICFFAVEFVYLGGWIVRSGLGMSSYEA